MMALFVLAQKERPQPLLSRGFFMPIKMALAVSLEGEERGLFVGRNDVNYAIDGDTVEIVITKVADQKQREQQK